MNAENQKSAADSAGKTSKADQWAGRLLVVLAFCLPLSTSASSVTGVLIGLLVIFGGNLREKLKLAGRNPLVWAILIYFVLHVVGLLWTSDMELGLKMVKKQWKLLLFPLFLVAANRQDLPKITTAFIAAMTLLAAKAYLVLFGFVTLPPGSIFTTEGTSHVVFNPLLALACYLLLFNALFRVKSRTGKWLRIGLFVFLSVAMFITVGRTGQLAYFALLGIITVQYFCKDSLKPLWMICILIPLLAVGFYTTSPIFKSRIDTAIEEARDFRSQKITSMGCRVWFCSNSLQLVLENMPFGVGTGDFPVEYAKINKINSPVLPNTDNPHNQYLLVLAQFGFAGLLALLGIFSTQLFIASRSHDQLRPLRFAFALFFLFIMMAESYLMVHETAFLFSLFSAFLFSSVIGRDKPEPGSASLPDNQRILIIKQSSLGDIVHTLPLVHAIKRSWPDSFIGWVVQKGFSPMVENDSAVDRVHTVEIPSTSEPGAEKGVYGRALDATLATIKKLRQTFKDAPYDLVLDLHASFRSGLIGHCNSSGTHIGFSDAKEFNTRFQDQLIEVGDQPVHAQDKNLLFADFLELQVTEEDFYYETTDLDEEAVDQYLGNGSANLIYFNPVGRWQSKFWPPENWAALADRFQENGYRVVLAGSPQDRETLTSIGDKMNSQPLISGGSLSLTQSAALIKRSALYVGVDSGPMHIAALAGTPVAALFGPTDPRLVGPYQVPHRVIRNESLDCLCCRKRSCEELTCMKSISVDQVYDQSLELLKETGDSGPVQEVST
ncbi:MAG: glycosyltransferase family 9 protein [Thermodesulfobacteriota bacterium]